MSFNEFAVAHELAIRLVAFAGVFAVMAGWETVAPRRVQALPRRVRWPHNLALVLLNSVLVRLLFPLAAVGFAALASECGWGVLNAVELPFWLAFLLSVVALDLVIYLQHVMFHAVPVLWRLHRVHHADPDFDVTTGARFHPIEIVLSILIKLAAIAVLGAPALAVLAFELLLNACAMFNHANVKIPAPVDHVLRRLVVTPDMHRIHHSMEIAEANSNFGFNVPWWDRLFGTYCADARLPQETMEIGVTNLAGVERIVKLPGMLALPFVDADDNVTAGSSVRPGHEAG